MESNTLSQTLQFLLFSIETKYHHDFYLPRYQSVLWVNLSDKSILIDNTIAKSKEYHADFDEQKIKNLYEEFYKIIKFDDIISLDQTLIYKELYKIFT